MIRSEFVNERKRFYSTQLYQNYRANDISMENFSIQNATGDPIFQSRQKRVSIKFKEQENGSNNDKCILDQSSTCVLKKKRTKRMERPILAS